jgi:hypothetical protein
MINRCAAAAGRINIGKGAMIMKGGCDDYGRGVRCIKAPTEHTSWITCHRL